MGKVHEDDLKHSHAPGHMGEYHRNLRQQIARQKFQKGDAAVCGKQSVQAGGGDNQIKSGNKGLRQGDVQRGKGEFLAEQFDGSSFRPPADKQIDQTQSHQRTAKRADMVGRNAEFGRNIQRNEQKNGAGKPHGADPESDGQHKHQAYDIQCAEPPGGIKAVTHCAAAEQCAEIVADDASDEGNKAYTGKSKFFVNGFESKPVIANQHHIIDNHEPERQQQLGKRNLVQAVLDFSKAVAAQLVIQQPYRQGKNAQNRDLAQDAQIFFHIRVFSPYARRARFAAGGIPCMPLSRYKSILSSP